MGASRRFANFNLVSRIKEDRRALMTHKFSTANGKFTWQNSVEIVEIGFIKLHEIHLLYLIVLIVNVLFSAQHRIEYNPFRPYLRSKENYQ